MKIRKLQIIPNNCAAKLNFFLSNFSSLNAGGLKHIQCLITVFQNSE